MYEPFMKKLLIGYLTSYSDIKIQKQKEIGLKTNLESLYGYFFIFQKPNDYRFKNLYQYFYLGR
jgi:hypothetical protein